MADDNRTSLFENLFGFALRSPKQEVRKQDLKSPFPPVEDDGALLIQDGAGAFTSSFLDYGKLVQNEIDLITKYRTMAVHPEVETAIDDIINEIVSFDEEGLLIDIDLAELEDVNDATKERIAEEHKFLFRLLKFKQYGYNVLRKWYIDGRSYYHVMIDPENPKAGIQELRYIDPRKIRFVKREKRIATHTALVHMHDRYEEFFLYNPNAVASLESGLKVAKDAIVFVHSGIMDETGMVVLSQLHKALKLLNQLKWMEDALVIYRLVRAPERRVFTIDVEDIPPAKAKAYVEQIANAQKNKIMYDTATGVVDTEKRFLVMTDDFYLPQRSGKGTSVTQLQGGENLGKLEDVDYFRRKLLKALNVPASRLEQDSLFNTGRSSEITRDEVKYQKFIDRQRQQFATLFLGLLRVQLILKGICSLSEWETWAPMIRFSFLKDNFFAELKDNEILNQRLEVVERIEPYTQKYFSAEYVRRHVLKQDDEDIKRLEKERKVEESQGLQPAGPGAMPPSPFGDPNMPMDPNAPPDPNAPGMLGGPAADTGFGANPTGGGNNVLPFNKKKPPSMLTNSKLTADAVALAKILAENADLNSGERITLKGQNNEPNPRSSQRGYRR